MTTEQQQAVYNYELLKKFIETTKDVNTLRNILIELLDNGSDSSEIERIIRDYNI
jgi:hypothetical protein